MPWPTHLIFQMKEMFVCYRPQEMPHDPDWICFFSENDNCDVESNHDSNQNHHILTFAG